MKRRLRCSIIEEFDDISSEILENIKTGQKIEPKVKKQ
jgi:hypothetical protein